MSITILTGDCRQTLATLPEKSVQMCVTSPPYFGLRDYKVAGQIGLEPTPDEYVREMVAVFSAVRRVLKDDGVLWLNLGDSYSGSGKGAWSNSSQRELHAGEAKEVYIPTREEIPLAGKKFGKPKDLIGIPWRVAFALQADGWYLRAACPWIKRNGMPDSTQDRPTQCIETVFMLTKSAKCYYDAEAVKKECSADMKRRALNGHTRGAGGKIDDSRCDASTLRGEHAKTIDVSRGRLRRTSDWFFESWQGLLLDSDDEPSAFVVNTKGYKGAHFATFPTSLVEPCILSCSSEKGECAQCGKPLVRVVEKISKDVPRHIDGHGAHCPVSHHTGQTPHRVGGFEQKSTTLGWQPQCTCGRNPIPQTILDPFGGSGTTGEVAQKHGRNAILCELNPEYVKLAEKRCGLDAPQQPELFAP